MPKRKVDVFAGEGSLSDKLRKRRESMEAGDPSGGQMPEMAANHKTEDDDNHPRRVLLRGYFTEKD